jgi:hypothetical protein
MIVLDVPLLAETRAVILLRSPTNFYIRRTNWYPSGENYAISDDYLIVNNSHVVQTADIKGVKELGTHHSIHTLTDGRRLVFARQLNHEFPQLFPRLKDNTVALVGDFVITYLDLPIQHGQVVTAAIPAVDGLTVAALAGRWWGGDNLVAASVTLFDLD